MKQAYAHWIEQKLKVDDPMAQCHEWSLEMQRAFPELELQAGIVLLSNGIEREHWWLKTAQGEIVDPTASQFFTDYFGFAMVQHYQYIPPGQRPTGRCMNCGEYCYDGRTDFCSDSCGEAYAAYVTAGVRNA